MLSCRFLTDISKTLLRAFKQGTAGCFISRDIRSTSGQTFGYPTLLNKVGLFCNFWLWLVVILMPLEIKLHAVPHLKGLINGKTYLVGKSLSVILHNLKLIWKVPILLHTELIVWILFYWSVSKLNCRKSAIYWQSYALN